MIGTPAKQEPTPAEESEPGMESGVAVADGVEGDDVVADDGDDVGIGAGDAAASQYTGHEAKVTRRKG